MHLWQAIALGSSMIRQKPVVDHRKIGIQVSVAPSRWLSWQSARNMPPIPVSVRTSAYVFACGENYTPAYFQNSILAADSSREPINLEAFIDWVP